MSDPTRRLRDFERRRTNNDHLVVDRSRGWEYIPVHPCADETELLATRSMAPEECSSVDLWWSDGEDVMFVEIWGTSSGERDSGIYARAGDGAVAAFVVVALSVNLRSLRTSSRPFSIVARILG